MKKIALIGNLRFNYGYPSNHIKWMDTQNDYFTNTLFPTLTAELSQNDYIVLMGNTFELVHALPLEIIEHYTKFLNRLKDIAQVLIINGIKDTTKVNGEIKTLNYFSNQIENVSIIDTITHIGNVTILPLKFTLNDVLNNPPSNNASILISNKKDTTLQHTVFTPYSTKITAVLPSTIKNTTIIGNCIQMNENEHSEIVGISIIDAQTLEIKTSENLRSPRYITINIETVEDITALESNTTKNHIHLVLDNTLLKNDRSSKRRIEMLLNKRIFNRISYIGNENEKEGYVVNKDIINIDPNLPYDVIIRDHIKNYTPSHINTDALFTEYDNVYRIFQEKTSD